MLVDFTVRNTGKLPALSVFPWAHLVFFTNETVEEAAKDTHPACQNREASWLKVGTSVFPQETVPINKINIGSFPPANKKIPEGNFKLLMVGCLLYRSSEDAEIHRTPFAALISHAGEVEFSNVNGEVPQLDKLKVPGYSNPD